MLKDMKDRGNWGIQQSLVFGCHDHQGEEQRLHFCVDYRRLNDITTKICFLLQRMDNTLHILARATWFSILDLKSGYWQIALYLTGKGRQHSLSVWGCGSSQLCLLATVTLWKHSGS
jgi:hypothetical protein